MRVYNDCPVPLLQDEWEFKKFMEFYMNFSPQRMLEIGTFYGGTLWHWLYFNDNLKKIALIDMPITQADQRYWEMVHSKSKWDSWFEETQVQHHLLSQDSTDSATVKYVHENIFPEKDVDMLFIDGGHDYNTVMSDFNNYQDLVKDGGHIVMHDVIGLGDVNRAWMEIRKSGCHSIEICANHNQGWGIGIIYK